MDDCLGGQLRAKSLGQIICSRKTRLSTNLPIRVKSFNLKLYFLDVMKVKNHLKVVLSCLLDMMEGLRVFKSIFSTPFQIFTNRARYKTHAKRVINHFVNDHRTD